MIEDIYQQLHGIETDINEHFPTLKKYALLSDRIVELGVRGIVSTWALLAGHPKEMISVDIVSPTEHGGDIRATTEIAKDGGTDWRFYKGSSLDIELARCDLLFIDTIHSYEQLSQELKLHSPHTTKYIIMHDTNVEEMQRAINEFLLGNEDWMIKERFLNNNGLVVLQRV